MKHGLSDRHPDVDKRSQRREVRVELVVLPPSLHRQSLVLRGGGFRFDQRLGEPLRLLGESRELPVSLGGCSLGGGGCGGGFIRFKNRRVSFTRGRHGPLLGGVEARLEIGRALVRDRQFTRGVVRDDRVRLGAGILGDTLEFLSLSRESSGVRLGLRRRLAEFSRARLSRDDIRAEFRELRVRRPGRISEPFDIEPGGGE